ncbi:MAG: methyltransferase domain protein [Bacteroidetes bacterium]|nr:methyltransferase domain protein [Bacteroidota bacterium]
MKTGLRGMLPQSLRLFLRKVYYAPRDIIETIKGNRSGLIPPTRMIKSIGGGDFRKGGEEFLKLFIDIGGLKRTDAVLDVGCGVGRMAIPLTSWLDATARYEGFDITPEEIRWCQKHITPRFPNFHFRHSDVYSHVYNPTAKTRASEYRFPFGDAMFDFVFLTSVFTHMLPADLENYLAEIARVLKPGGRSFITYFLLNNESRELLRQGRSTLDFKFQLDGCMTTDMGAPESALAYSEESVRILNTKHGLEVGPRIWYGFWCGRSEHTSYQDIVVSTRI